MDDANALVELCADTAFRTTKAALESDNRYSALQVAASTAAAVRKLKNPPKHATEAAEREREQAREEKAQRATRLWIALGLTDVPRDMTYSNAVIGFTFEDHRFEVREAHREE